MHKKYIYMLFLAVTVIWGLDWTVSKTILFTVPPLWSAAIRASLATCALFMLQTATRQCIIPKKHDLPAVFVVSFFLFVLYILCMSIGLSYLPVGRSVVLAFTTPLWVVPAAVVILREPVGKVKMCGVFLGLVGLLILVNPVSLATSDAQHLLGNILLLTASLCWAVAIVFIKYHTWHATPFQLVPWQILLAAIALSALALFFEGPPQFTVTFELGYLFAYTALLGAAFGYWAITMVNKHLPAVVVSLGSLMTPVVGIASSQIFLCETIDLPLIIGGTLILLGIVVICLASNTIKNQA